MVEHALAIEWVHVILLNRRYGINRRSYSFTKKTMTTIEGRAALEAKKRRGGL